MIIFKKDLGRVIPRSKALGFKELVLSDDIEMGDEISIVAGNTEATKGKLIIVKNNESSVPEGAEPEYIFLTNEIGVFGGNKGVKCELEIKFCDDIMLINLIKGAFVIRPEDKNLVASRQIDESCLPQVFNENIKWIGVEQLIGFCKYFGKLSNNYPFDYEYTVEVSGGIDDKKLSSLRVKPISDCVDISFGALAVKEQELAHKEAVKESKRMTTLLTAATKGVDNDFDDYDDTDDEDEDFSYDI